MELEYGRPLPPELLVEMHKCLPLADAIYVMVNVSKTFVLNNSTRMRRNIQRLKTYLNEDTLIVGQQEYIEEDNDLVKLMFFENDLEWKPQLDALFRYGAWLTSFREFLMMDDNIIEGMPKNFVEKLLLHMAYSRSPQMMLHRVEIRLGEESIFPIPTFLKPLFNNKRDRTLFESVDLEIENGGQILHIFDGEYEGNDEFAELRLFMANKMDPKNWFRILIEVDSSEKFIQQFVFSKWNFQQSFDVANFVKEEFDLNGGQIEQNGNKLEAKSGIHWDQNLDMFLRRGAGFSQFRHFKINERYFLKIYDQPKDYVQFLISTVSNTKHPEDFLESIEMKLDCSSALIEKFWTIFYKGIPDVGISINLDKTKLHILSAKIAESKSEFTLANIPTNGNGTYLFDVEVKFGKEGIKQIVGIKIQKRKKNIGDIVELKCDDQIGVGMKRKATNDVGEDGPTCSAKLMKK